MLRVMGKYDGLRDLLARQSESRVRLSFAQVEAVVPGGLPASAFRHAAWWSNEESGTHSHARSWLERGWRVTELDLRGREVSFARASPSAGES